MFPHSTDPVEKFWIILQARVDVGCNVPNIVLQAGVGIGVFVLFVFQKVEPVLAIITADIKVILRAELMA